MAATLIEQFAAICGDTHVIPGAQASNQYLRDFLHEQTGRALAVLKPQTTAQVAAIVRLCAKTQTPIVPQGGNTGYRAGGVPDNGGRAVVVALEKMCAIRHIDVVARTMHVLSGCILQDAQVAAAAKGLLFPLTIGAKGACQIGGNLATNAGGTNFLRYGGAREVCLGIEAVLPNGEVMNLMSGARKNNAGYDLKNLLIGSEGTLGIITAAALRLSALPQHRAAAFVGVDNVEKAMAFFNYCQQNMGDTLHCFELLPHLLLSLLQKHFPQTAIPLATLPPLAILVEAAADDDAIDEKLRATLAAALRAGIIGDAALPSSESQRRQLWQLRELAPEASKREGRWLKLDVALPLSQIVAFVDAAEQLLLATAGAYIVAFGHLGDGNLHLSLRPHYCAPEENPALSQQLKMQLLDIVADLGGSFSAEHGIGRTHITALQKYQDPAALAAMRAIKTALDPNNIMNPGVLFADAAR